MRAPVLLTPMLMLAACGSNADAASGDSRTATRSFQVTDFTSVALAGSDNVRVVRGGHAPVTATGPADVLDRLDIRVEGSQLKIGRKQGNGWNMISGRRGNVVITVTTPRIDAAALSGSGNLSIDHVSGPGFRGSLGGSGKLTLADVRVDKIALDLAGSGDVSASGSARTVRFSVGGSGNLDAAALVSQDANLSVNGSGNLQVVARHSATISLAGSGDVSVRGTTNCQIAKSGSGDARCQP